MMRRDFIRYIPHTEEDIRKMLDAIGVKNLEDLFDAIPKEYRVPNLCSEMWKTPKLY